MAAGRRATARATAPLGDAWRLAELIEGYCPDAIDFLAKSKVEETVHQWLAKAGLDPDDPQSGYTAIEAFALAANLAVFTPSLTGVKPIDRLIRQRRSDVGREGRAAMDALSRASFRLLRLRTRQSSELFLVEDLTNGETLSILDEDIPASGAGVALAAWLCPLPDGIFLSVGPLTPLDATALDVATGFMRPGRGLANPQRCAAALYRHIVRHGALRVEGLNAFPEHEDESFAPDTDARDDECDLDRLAEAWAALGNGVEPPTASVNEARSLASFDHLMRALSACVVLRRRGETRLAEAYSRLALIQMETFQRRAIAGTGGEAPLEHIGAAIDRAIAERRLPPDVRPLYDELRRRLVVSSGLGRNGAAAGGEELARVLQRIQALRAKTVDQGCTEQEALASANKVAELLDRYGLSLSEIEIRRQACEGVGVDTGRRRRGALDECVPSIMFCDCKVWSEKSSNGAIRYVFFGLPADVEAAHYLYDLIDVTFETETMLFKKGAVHAEMDAGERRSSVNSFQAGLGHGICHKLDIMKTERDAANRQSSGRDLVPLKTSVIEDELEKLGLSFHAQSHRRRKRVLVEAYEAGREAGRKFELRKGVETTSVDAA